MADSCAEYTVAGLTINAASGDTLMLDEQGGVEGLDGIALRRTKPPQGQGDGSIFLTSKKQHRIVVFRGVVLIRSVEWNDDPVAYRAAQQTLCDAWVAALATLDNASGTLTWPGHSLTVYRDGGPNFTGPEFGKKFILGLYAPNPTIS